MFSTKAHLMTYNMLRCYQFLKPGVRIANTRLFSSHGWSLFAKSSINHHRSRINRMKDMRGMTTLPPVNLGSSLIQEFAPATAVFPDDSMKPLTLSCYRGQYVILLFYPLDFTFVCPTELLAFHQHVKAFEKRNAQVIGVSVDSPFCHTMWRSLPLNQGGISRIDFPLVSDLGKTISRNYRVLTKDQTMSVRALFLIDKEGIIRHYVVNDLPLGRHVDEALRILDALQHVETTGDVCPGNWSKGAKSIKPSNEDVVDYLKTLPGA